MQDKLNDNNFRMATVATIDTNGLLRGQKVSRSNLEGILKNGMGMAPAQLALDPTDAILPLPGVTDDSGSFNDSMLQVDQDSCCSIPFEAPGHDLLFLAQFSGEYAALCPRSILSNVIKRGKAMGITPKYGMELEYTLFNETSASLQDKGFRNLQPATAHASHDLVIYQAAQSDWYKDVVEMCEPLGIDLIKMHEEIGPGFMEACIGPGKDLETADQAVLLKNFLRVLAMKQDKTITFMPRWSEQADSQSSHIHTSLLGNDGTPLFWDASKPDNMSDTFRHFVGGLQKYLGAMMLLFAPTVNSYRRFVEGTFAPPALSWGIENRTTCFRIVGEDPSSIRVENRLPGADTNPYLTMAATLAAGYAGIAEKCQPSAAVVGNGYLPGTTDGLEFPHQMSNAIAALRASEHAKQWLGERFVEGYATSREGQLAEFQSKVPDTELMRFFELG
jgi:glutamine synthetase